MNPPPLPTLLLLLLPAAALFFSSTTSAARCPDCGPTPVPYPLSTAPTCGDPAYAIRCDAGALTFDTVNSSYPILSINPSNQRFVIRPAGLLAPNTCVASDYVDQGLQLNSSLPFNITGSNTIMYLNCSAATLLSPLNCSRAGICHVYANGTAAYSACRRAPVCCTFRAGGSTTAYMIRVRESGCRAYASFVDLDPGLPVDRWPDPGVEIQWALPREPFCGSEMDCEGNSSCGPDLNSSGPARCFCKNGLQWDPTQGICSPGVTCDGGGRCGGRNRKRALIAGVAAGAGAALAAIAFAVTLQKRQRRLKRARYRLARERELQILRAGGSRTARIFSGKEIKKGTNNFSRDRLLGVGGYGEVYKAILYDGTTVAVKCAKLGNPKGTDQILNEVRILCQVNHRTLVGLLGCCIQLPQPVLVYEYIANGTLLDRLMGQKHGKVKPLTWLHRLRIARDTAEGLAYLHSSVVPPVYHRDVKSSNILLDEKFNARVSDFGLSRLAESDLSHISTCAQGTLGYLDPEYYRNYQLTDKSDVYSFGVVLLEILTGLKAIDLGRGEDDVNLVVYVKRMVAEGRLVEIVDPMMIARKGNGRDGNHLETMKAFAFLGLNCLEEKRQNRPSMKEVTEEIEYIISVAVGSSSDPPL